MRATPLVVTALALFAGMDSAQAATRTVDRGPAAQRLTPAMPKRLMSLSAAEFRQFVRDSVRWEERTKIWHNHETAMNLTLPSRVTRLWAVAEPNLVRLREEQLGDRKPRIIAMFGNDGPFAYHGMEPGDTLYFVLEMDQKSDEVQGYAVVVSSGGRIQVYSVGQPSVCHAWTPTPGTWDDVSMVGFINPKSCIGTPNNSHTSAPRSSLSRTDRFVDNVAAADAVAADAIAGPQLARESTEPVWEARSPAHMAAHRNGDGIRGVYGYTGCTGWFTCASGSCAIEFPDAPGSYVVGTMN